MKPTQKLTFSINPLVIIIILLVVIVSMLALWRPWESTKTARTITMTGQASVDSTPDQFVFSPYFQRTGTDTSALKTQLDTFGTTLLAGLQNLGVPKDDITLGSNSYGQPAVSPAEPTTNNESTASLSVSIKVSSEQLAQKVQDYLATTDAQGQITSQPSFSDQKRRSLENQARDQAVTDAKTKATATAKNLGVSLGKVVTVKDEPNQGIAYPLVAEGSNATTSNSLPVTPGKDSVTIEVEVVFELH